MKAGEVTQWQLDIRFDQHAAVLSEREGIAGRKVGQCEQIYVTEGRVIAFGIYRVVRGFIGNLAGVGIQVFPGRYVQVFAAELLIQVEHRGNSRRKESFFCSAPEQ